MSARDWSIQGKILLTYKWQIKEKKLGLLIWYWRLHIIRMHNAGIIATGLSKNRLKFGCLKITIELGTKWNVLFCYKCNHPNFFMRKLMNPSWDWHYKYIFSMLRKIINLFFHFGALSFPTTLILCQVGGKVAKGCHVYKRQCQEMG